MENAAKALQIAAGVLLAVMILSLAVYFFSTISAWPTQEDDMESAEQLAKFNMEYEVYDKSLMYGVDVISCLNKAKSNNEKYTEYGVDDSGSKTSTGFFSGAKYGKDYNVNVYVKINKVLTETLEIYYFDKKDNNGNDYETTRVNTTNDEWDELSNVDPTKKQLHALGIDKQLNSANFYTLLNPDMSLCNQYEELTTNDFLQPDKGYYSLEDEAILKLLKFSSSTPKITIKNPDSATLRYWSKAVWSTALYDFKTRRFTCDSIEYSNVTGRVTKIYFSEVSNEE